MPRIIRQPVIAPSAVAGYDHTPPLMMGARSRPDARCNAGCEPEPLKLEMAGETTGSKPTYKFGGLLPAALVNLRHVKCWVPWGYVLNKTRKKWDKVPYDPHTGRIGDSSDPAKWGTYDEAFACTRQHDLAGVGIALTPTLGIVGGDLDGCITDPGSLTPLAAEVIGYRETYAEVSPSGEGIRFLALGEIEKAHVDNSAGVELYKGRGLTITGNQFVDTPAYIAEAPRTLARLIEVVEAAREAKRKARVQGKQLAIIDNNFKAISGQVSLLAGGDGFFDNVKARALSGLDTWVPALFPMAVKSANGAWRVTSADLGRDYEEDLSLHPSGIQDYGPETGLTAIDVMINYGGAHDAVDAALQLCKLMGIHPATLGWKQQTGGGGLRRRVEADVTGAAPSENGTWEPKGEDEEDKALQAKMNARYAVVNISGKTRVMSMEESPAYPGCMIPVYSSIADFCAFHAHPKMIQISAATGKVREVGLGTWWIGHEQRRQYDGVVYAPGAGPENTRGKLNLWAGFGCAPGKGSCELYLAHLRDNICCKVDAHYQYLLNWMAHAAQNPGRQGEVALVMQGKEGTGKGVTAKEFGRLFGAHFRHISQAGHLTGHFNAHLQQCSVLFADEAFFAGNRSHEGILKALITEETLIIEPKGLDAFAVRNCLHLIMSSNAEWVIPASADARRYFVLAVADHHKQDHAYFAAITREMDNGGREALLCELLNRDLSSFNVRDVPQTDALADQKAHTRRGVDCLVEMLAHSGMLPAVHGAYPNIAVTSGEEDGNGFYPKARSLVPDLKYDSSIVIATALKRWGCEPWHSGPLRGIKFPPLAELRAVFNQKHGKQAWPPYNDGVERDWGDT